ncbi:MAG: hypothetical protein JXA14_23545 [Anaerolineae bacterium]|nr:hypothetical protein [Anaerolineae bacterium]
MTKLADIPERMRRVSRAFPLLFNARTPALFILGALLLEIVASAGYDLLRILLGDSWTASLWAMLIALVLLVLVVVGLYLVVASQHSSGGILGKEERASQRPGLVVFLSTGPGKADEEALKFHMDGGLKYAWLVVTHEVEADEKLDRLVTEYRGKDVVVDPRPLANPRDANEAYLVVKNILDDADRRGLDRSKLYVDITGCMRPTAVGATLACAERGHDLEYVVCRYDDRGRCVPGTSEVMEIPLSDAPFSESARKTEGEV